MADSEDTYLGLDLSTQKLKAVILNSKLTVMKSAEVHFDSELPEFRTHGGFVGRQESPKEYYVPTIMWVKALDVLLDKFICEGADFSQCVAISGCAQQHGSVYWQADATQQLRNLKPEKFLHEQLSAAFSVTNSPIWMDSSTTSQCQEIERAVGGPLNLAKITGSRAYERFTGAQIRKLYQQRPDAYNNTKHISLVSSFLASLFLGDIGRIDYADASGMNLFDIRTKKWSLECLEACAPDLQAKLMEPADCKDCLGCVSTYMVERFGFSDKCKVIAFTGDNPSTFAGMALGEDWIGVSLGTSDTLLMWLSEAIAVLQGHVMCNPLDNDSYMAMLCFRNGALTREQYRDMCADSSWEIFNELLNNTPRGNFGNIGLYYTAHEIIPARLYGAYRYNKTGEKVIRFASKEVEARAVIEGQFISRRAHAMEMGFKFGPNTKILASGGSSNNKAILQILSDVFNANVYTQSIHDCAMVGAGYRAMHGWYKSMHADHDSSYLDIMQRIEDEHQLVCTPYKDAADIYDPMVEQYCTIVKTLTDNLK